MRRVRITRVAILNVDRPVPTYHAYGDRVCRLTLDTGQTGTLYVMKCGQWFDPDEPAAVTLRIDHARKIGRPCRVCWPPA